MLASFNYYPPTTGAIAVGVGVGVFILLALYFAQSALKVSLLGAISWGVIAVVVCGTGRGDMTGFAQIFWGFVCGVAGAVAGLLVGLLGKWMAKSHDMETGSRQDVEQSEPNRLDVVNRPPLREQQHDEST